MEGLFFLMPGFAFLLAVAIFYIVESKL